jgi:membrane fusion protein, multidrug efflux system
MADQVLKFPPEQKGNPQQPATRPPATPRSGLMASLRRYRRTLLLVVLPLVALLGGAVFYLNGAVTYPPTTLMSARRRF